MEFYISKMQSQLFQLGNVTIETVAVSPSRASYGVSMMRILDEFDYAWSCCGHFILVLKSPGDRSQILRDANNKLLNTHKISQIYDVMMDTLEVVRSFMRSIKKLIRTCWF